MGRASIYVETSVLSYLTARPTRDVLVLAHQELTRQFWEAERGKYRLFVSERVIQEAGRGDADAAEKRLQFLAELEQLESVPEIDALAARLCEALQLPPKALTDGYHLAFAVYYELDYLLTWNCTHLASGPKLKALAGFARESGLWLPIVCTPEEMAPWPGGDIDVE